VQENHKQLRLLAVSHAVNHVYQLLTPVILPELTREFGASSAEIFLWSFVLSYSLLPAVMGYVSRYIGKRNMLTVGFVVTALSFLAIGLTDNVSLIAVLFFLAGVGGSTYHPLGSPILAEAYPTNRGRILGLHQTGGAVGSFVGPIIAGLLVLSVGWRPALMLLVVPGLVLALTMGVSISHDKSLEKAVPRGGSGARVADLKAYTPAIIFIIAAFIYVFGLRGTDVFANEYFVLGRGIEIAGASFLFSMLKVAGLFSAPICGRLSDSYGRKAVLVMLVAVESLSLLSITFSPDIFLIIPCVFFGFAAFGLLAVGEALLADVTPEKHRPTLFGINLTASFSPQIFLVPVLFGLAGSSGYNSGFILMSALMPISIPLLLMVKTQHAKT